MKRSVVSALQLWFQAVLFACIAISFLFAWQNVASLQMRQVKGRDDKSERPITVQAAKRGNPYVNFDDGRELGIEQNAAAAQPIALVSADFDSDGFADVVTADSTGGLQLLKGSDPSQFAVNARVNEKSVPEPFTAKATGASLGTTADYLFVGDFNADGMADIIGAAKGSKDIVILSGDGLGHFSPPTNISVGGNITAIESGEIGRPDGQADLAVTYSNSKGNFLAVFEHPESAFKHAPEIIKLPSAATAVAVGNMDEDYYSDIAVACGSNLIVVHERGQAYPWDIVKGSGITRPPAVVETRQMSFSIVSMTVGRFGEKRGTSLAILGGDGNIYRLEPTRKITGSNINVPLPKLPNTIELPFAPTETDTRRYAFLDQKGIYSNKSTDEAGNLLVDANEIRGVGRDEYFKKRDDEAAKGVKEYSPEDVAKIRADGLNKRAEMDARQREAFIRTISAKTSNLKGWRMETISAGAQFASAANGNAELIRLNVSDSNLDDLMVTAKGSGEMQFVSRQKNDNGNLRAEISSVSAVSGVLAALPMRLNLDGLHDLVVLQAGAVSPSVVMTAPTSVFTVNTTDDNTTCQAFPDPCSLRGAIIEANANPGNNIISFALPFGTVISPQSPLPSINKTMSLQSGHLPDGTRGVEISGTNAGASVDGLKIRASNVFISNLAVNGFKSTIVSGGQVGGNGIVIASDSGAPNIGNNTVWECFLGTDATGNIDRGNDATGVLIFDSDNNGITGSVLSGNGSDTKAGYGLGVTDGNSNGFTNNIIGLNAAGNAKLGNSVGILLTGANNSIGNDFADSGNTISGNGRTNPGSPGQCSLTSFYSASGITTATLVDVTTGAFLTQNNNIVSNFIGTNPGGTQPLGNCYGAINTSPLHQTTIGSIAQSGRNIVSDNGFNAIACTEEYLYGVVEGGYCAIAGNNIGTDVSGTTAMPNNDRNYIGGIDRARGTVEFYYSSAVSYFGAPGGTSDNACTGFCNLYSSNNPGVEEGIYFSGGGTIGFFNNYIGTTAQGDQPLGNISAMDIGNSSGSMYVGGVGTDSGGGTISLGNLISGNRRGLSAFSFGAEGNSSTLTIEGNRIGTDASGILAIPNGNNGIPSNAQPAVNITRGFTENTVIGGTDPLARNIISGNDGDGIIMSSGFNSGIFNNLIGVNISLAPLGNGGTGIAIRSSFTQIGGNGGLANHIAYNGTNTTGIRAGVAVLGSGATPAIGNTIRGNSIHDNNGLAIDLGVRDPRPGFNGYLPDGLTINDYCSQDSDIGPNMLQNFPELFPPTANMDGTVSVEGFIRSIPHENFDIDIYSSQTADPSGHGEGQSYLGSASTTTDGNGFGAFTFRSTTTVSATSAISATATDNNGNTSEFSCNAGAGCNDLNGAANLAEYIASPQEACPASISVNLAGDESDANPNDGFCDIDVTNSDNHECTLRAALQIIMRDGYVGTHTINFEIPGPGVHMITTTGLPTITKYVVIDGESQPGYVDKPLIEIRGTGNTAGTGLELQSTGSTIKGLALNNFFDHAIHINGGSDNRIQSCFIGVAADGVTPGPDLETSTGILVENSHDNTIGGSTTGARNLIDHVFYGIYLSGGRQNFVYNNYVGMDVTGGVGIGNNIGIYILGSNDNWIGKSLDVDGNLISANLYGIKMDSNSASNKIKGNYIGTKAGGDVSFGNVGQGISIAGGVTNTIIGDPLNMAGRNIISGQNLAPNSAGIFINYDAGIDNKIYGNNIGVNKDATAKIPNRHGIVILADKQTVGGTSGGIYNVISGNQDNGILVTKPLDSPNVEINNNLISFNYIGTGRHQETDLGNGKFGIVMEGKIVGNTIRGNIASGNALAGIFIVEPQGADGNPTNNLIIENKVGVDENSNIPIPNAVGMILKGATNNRIGKNTISGNTTIGLLLGALGSYGAPFESQFQSTVPGLANLISDVQYEGIWLKSSDRPSDINTPITTGNQIYNNSVGVDNAGESPTASSPIKNGVMGIAVGEFAHINCIGSCDPTITEGGPGNTISGQLQIPLGGETGVFLGTLGTSVSEIAKPHGNKFRDNIIGVNRSLTNCIPNTFGFLVTQAGGNIIGETTVHAQTGGNVRHGNIIACNAKNAIEVRDNEIGDLEIKSNWIGTTPNIGIPILGNDGFGGILVLADRERETKRIWVDANTIGNNRGSGIGVHLTGSSPRPSKRSEGTSPLIEISGNEIGVGQDENGEYIPIQNGVGIELDCVSDAYIGDFTGGGTRKNIIAGNLNSGIRILGGSSSTDQCGDVGSNVVTDSIIGTDPVGSPNIGNGGDGIEIKDSGSNTVKANMIGGNSGNGIHVFGFGSQSNQLMGNEIGVITLPPTLRADATQVKCPNGMAGVNLEGSWTTQIGGNQNGQPNTIAGNAGNGIVVDGSNFNLILNNSIGVDSNGATDIGNGENGIKITNGSSTNAIGFQIPNSDNKIAFNGDAGVLIDKSAGDKNLVYHNGIYSNAALGIDLGEPGHNSNDPEDADEGPNRLQNYPEILSFSVNGSGDLIASYRVDTDPANATYPLYCEFFIADQSGEGKTFLASDYYTEADHAGPSSGTKSINMGLASELGWTSGDLMTSSATDGENNTSEFFPTGTTPTPTPTPTATITETPTPTPTATATPLPLRSRADFDGDGKTDLSVFRPAEGVWYLKRSHDGLIHERFGSNGDVPVPGDFDNDGKTDIVVFRPNPDNLTPDYYLLNSSTSTISYCVWGNPGDIPIAGDFDGDGKSDFALYRSTDNIWYVLRSTGGFVNSAFGVSGDIAVGMDYDGDSKTNLTVFRPSSGTWYIARPSGNPAQNFDAVVFGQAGDIPVPADYDGDNVDDIAVFRPSTGTWWIRGSIAGLVVKQFGINGDTPVPGDYDGDGKDDVAIFRNGTWYIDRSAKGLMQEVFGTGSDIPIPKKYLP